MDVPVVVAHCKDVQPRIGVGPPSPRQRVLQRVDVLVTFGEDALCGESARAILSRPAATLGTRRLAGDTRVRLSLRCRKTECSSHAYAVDTRALMSRSSGAMDVPPARSASSRALTTTSSLRSRAAS